MDHEDLEFFPKNITQKPASHSPFNSLAVLVRYSQVHSRDDEEVGVAHEVKSPVNQPQFSQKTMGQYWLGRTKPK